jgi:hypothetical protein
MSSSVLSLLSSATTLRSNRLIFFFGTGASVASEGAAGLSRTFALASSLSSRLSFVAEHESSVTGDSSGFNFSSSEPDSSL